MTVNRPRVLVLTYTPFAREPRALKQVRYLREWCDITTAGFGAQPVAGVPHIELSDGPRQRGGFLGRLLYLLLLLLRIHRPISRLSALDAEVATLLRETDWDIVIAHDLITLDAALALEPRRGVVLDMHEYAPKQNEHSRLWRLLVAPYIRWMLRVVVPRVAQMVTVGQGIADEYRREFGVESIVVINATPYQELAPVDAEGTLRLVHSGVAAAQRRLDLMIEGVRASTADVTLDFYLVPGPAGELEKLQELASGEDRIRFREPVPYDELVSRLNEYDVGLSIFPPTTFNLAWCLPNKFFDFVQARLGVIAGPSPEMARFIAETGIGEVLPDFETSSLAAALDTLTPARVMEWKLAADSCAHELSGEHQMEVWRRIIGRLMGEGAPAAP